MRCKHILPAMLTVLIVGLVAISSLSSQESERPTSGPYLAELLKAPPMQIAAGEGDLKRLSKERYNVALQELKARFTGWQSGTYPAEQVLDAGRRLLEAELAVADDPQAKVKVLEKQLGMVREYEAIIKARVTAATESNANLNRIQYERLSIEIDLLQAQQPR